MPLHEPGEHVSRLVAHEAVVAALLRNDGEVPVGAAVERTGTPVVGAGPLERHRLSDQPDDVGAVADLFDGLVGDHAHAENSTMVTPVPPWFRGANAYARYPPVLRDDALHPLAHDAGAHAMDDAQERLLRQHRGVHRRHRGDLGFVSRHAAKVDLQRGMSAGLRDRPAAGRRGSGTESTSRCFSLPDATVTVDESVTSRI